MEVGSSCKRSSRTAIMRFCIFSEYCASPWPSTPHGDGCHNGVRFPLRWLLVLGIVRGIWPSEESETQGSLDRSGSTNSAVKRALQFLNLQEQKTDFPLLCVTFSLKIIDSPH